MPNNSNQEIDRVTLDGRKKLQMTSVEEVDGFTEQTLKLTVAGVRVIVVGENIKITSYNKATGVLSAEGLINEIKYLGAKKSIIKRIFK